MKILAIIWSVFLFALATYPCCEDHVCHESETSIEIPSNETLPINSPCSPLHSCHACFGFIFNNSPIGIESNFTELSSTATPNTATINNPGFSVAIWQPPQH